MSKVHILPPELIAKIAAGEVVDRPASVLKELVENALDAGTDSIEVTLQQAGKTLLAIRDRGHGIAADDLETIFARHATSKIATVDDLFQIHSLGFRGEALYSIAAVADIVLRSRTPDRDTGWEVHLRGGERLGLKPVAMPAGTEIEVRELFFNTPARRKFLKSNTTELNQVLGIFIPYALLYPGVRFTLKHAEKTLVGLDPNDGPLPRAAETLNLESDHLLLAEHRADGGKISVTAVLGDINVARARRDLQFIFINNRPVQSKTLSFHMNQLYRLLLPQGAFPFFALYITMPPEDVDVNIHPTKREVKIRDEQSLAALVRHLCENALMSGGSTKQALWPDAVTPAAAPASAQPASPARRALSDISGREGGERSFSLKDEPGSRFPRPFGTTPTEQYAFPDKSILSPLGETVLVKQRDSLKTKLEQARLVGIFHNKYIFLESGPCLLAVDQHAAQERITFETLIRQMEKGRVEVQNLLTPYLIEMSPQEMLAWEEAKDTLEQTGFSSDQFGPQTVAVRSVPVLIKDPVAAVRDLLAGGDFARCDHETIARRACRSSIMAGDRLNDEQADSLRRRLLECRDPFTCPHGRPTVIELKEEFLDKQFLRT
jgi:DNA mismatch repair protein MutL